MSLFEMSEFKICDFKSMQIEQLEMILVHKIIFMKVGDITNQKNETVLVINLRA